MFHATLSSRSRAAAVILLLVMAASSPPAAAANRDASPKKEARGQDQPEAQKLDLNTASPRALAAVAAIGADGAQAIVAARPFTRIDDLNRLKGISAERLEQIRARVMVSPDTIPPRALEKALTPVPAPKEPSERTRADVNTASYETLAALPSIGPETAKAIIAARPFTHLDELNRLPGLSTERLEQIRLSLTLAETPRDKAKADRDTKPRATR